MGHGAQILSRAAESALLGELAEAQHITLPAHVYLCGRGAAHLPLLLLVVGGRARARGEL